MNKTSTRAEVVVQPEAVAMPSPDAAPSLPAREAPWHALTLDWWKDVWDVTANPFCTKYLRVDVHGLRRLAVIVDTFNITGDVDTLKEIRLQEPRWGLDQMARRSLQWEVKAPKKETPKPVAEKKSATPMDDPRKVLQMPVAVKR